MHFISLVAVEMPKITEDQAKNQEIEKCLEELREAYKQDSKTSFLNYKSRDCRDLPQSLPVPLTIVCAKL